MIFIFFSLLPLPKKIRALKETSAGISAENDAYKTCSLV